MKTSILAFGIAKDILGNNRLSFEWESGTSVKEFKKALMLKYPDFEKLASLNIAVNTDYVDDDYQLSDLDEVVLIPPVSGG